MVLCLQSILFGSHKALAKAVQVEETQLHCSAKPECVEPFVDALFSAASDAIDHITALLSQHSSNNEGVKFETIRDVV